MSGRARTESISVGEVMWEPSEDMRAAARMTEFARAAADHHPELGAEVAADHDYAALWRWSVEHLEDFWGEVWRFFDVGPESGYECVLAERTMPGARWFPGARLNYAGHILRYAATAPDKRALVAINEDGAVSEVSWGELADQVARFAASLDRMGVGVGDRVVAYLPNVPEAIIAVLACAARGVVWSACGPETGLSSAVDRFAQLEPAVLIAADGYRFGGREYDRRSLVEDLVAELPSVGHVVSVPVLGLAPSAASTASWDELIAQPADLDPVAVPFDHPLWVVYSSGTTGNPKGLVHGHGGILLTSLAQQLIQSDADPDGIRLSYTSTNWIMWNGTVSGLVSGATAVLYDGNPMYPSVDRLWQLAEQFGLGGLGVSPGYLRACEKAGLHPAAEHDLSALRGIGSTGSPLPLGAYHWVHDEVGPNVVLTSFSGGTDFAATLVSGSPWLPVYYGEMSCRSLGCYVEAWNAQGEPVIDEVGELVIRAPMPSMPLRIWGDEDGSRYHDSYFATFDGVWRHGDWLTVTSRGTCIIHGRSDSTLNRHGVRMGSGDIYQAVEAVPEIAEALVLGIEEPDGGYWLPLFVRLDDGAKLDDELVARVRAVIREQASPRHVPDEIIEVTALPHTKTGKKLEIPLKRIMQGADVASVCNLGAVDDPEAVEWFAQLARARKTAPRQAATDHA